MLVERWTGEMARAMIRGKKEVLRFGDIEGYGQHETAFTLGIFKKRGALPDWWACFVLISEPVRYTQAFADTHVAKAHSTVARDTCELFLRSNSCIWERQTQV